MSDVFINPFFYLILRRDENGELSFKIFNSEESASDKKGVWEDISVDNRLLKYDDEDNELEDFVDSLIEDIGRVYARMGIIYVSFKGSFEDSEKIETSIDRFNAKNNKPKIIFKNYDKSFSLVKSIESINRYIDDVKELYWKHSYIFQPYYFNNDNDLESLILGFDSLKVNPQIRQVEFIEKINPVYSHMDLIIRMFPDIFKYFDTEEEKAQVYFDSVKQASGTLQDFYDKEFSVVIDEVKRITNKHKRGFEVEVYEKTSTQFSSDYNALSEDKLIRISNLLMDNINSVYRRYYKAFVLPEICNIDKKIYEILVKYCNTYSTDKCSLTDSDFYTEFSFDNLLLPKLKELAELKYEPNKILSQVLAFGFMSFSVNHMGVKRYRNQYYITDFKEFTEEMLKLIPCHFCSASETYAVVSNKYKKITLPRLKEILPDIDDSDEFKKYRQQLDEIILNRTLVESMVDSLKNVREDIAKIKREFYEATGGEQI